MADPELGKMRTLGTEPKGTRDDCLNAIEEQCLIVVRAQSEFTMDHYKLLETLVVGRLANAVLEVVLHEQPEEPRPF